MQNINEGQKLSFKSLLTELPNKIEIPIIQRDYAQGRDKAVNIRNQFVNTLFDHLENEEPLHLDFIYGNVIEKDKKFIPLDGQQRLTTLFLLHWYLSMREGDFEDFQGIVANENGSRFTYETRQSSREFCDAIVKQPFDLDFSSNLSNQLRDFNWYFQSWDQDPTVQSMLVMLDTIQHTYNERGSEDLYAKLTGEVEIITFQFIELANYGLTDDLYIKMNARGKPLTDFENFKAKFEKIIKQFDQVGDSKFQEQFQSKIDGSWTDFMWQYRDTKTNTYDKAFMNLIGTIYGISLASIENVNIDSIKYLMGRNPNPKFDYYELDNRDCFEKNHVARFFDYMSLIESEGSLVNALSGNTLFSISKFLDDVFDYSNTLSYAKRIQFYALQEFQRQEYDINGLEQWMRVVRNLSENTFFREAPEFVNGIQSINDLLPHAQNILEFLVKGKEIRAFEGIQKNEEYVKAHLIKKGDYWSQLIYDIENHPYFEGQIGFILNFCGITDHFEKNNSLEWSDAYDVHFLDLFKKYTVLSNNIFDSNGLHSFGDFKFRRALLVFGDFTLEKGSNWSFVTNGTSREISWKALLKKDTYQRKHLGELFEFLDENKKIELQLDSIIENSDVKDWRQGFIEYPEILRKCGTNLYMRFINEQDILLLSKNQTNGLHHEYFTYYLECKLNEIGVLTDYQTANAADEYKGIISVNGKNCEIQWLRQEQSPVFNVIHDNQAYQEENICGCIKLMEKLEIIE
ncbi:DUF262 domain-containing protein [Nonlabens sp. Asnod3-H03]|uniref:DUF262 domain-containing protein n=1 Tax=Nonlabens sp. Asnod3-H03 TaxID=3160580 RepID=UPI003868C369